MDFLRITASLVFGIVRNFVPHIGLVRHCSRHNKGTFLLHGIFRSLQILALEPVLEESFATLGWRSQL